jgi:hypothetical protein
MIVSDAGPIIIFARIGRLSFLRNITGSLLIPDAVYNETVIKKGVMRGAAEVAQAAWIQKVSLSDRSIADNRPLGGAQFLVDRAKLDMFSAGRFARVPSICSSREQRSAARDSSAAIRAGIMVSVARSRQTSDLAMQNPFTPRRDVKNHPDLRNFHCTKTAHAVSSHKWAAVKVAKGAKSRSRR